MAEQLYVVTCNGVRYSHPQPKLESERYAALRRGDRKDPRRTGQSRDAIDNLTYGAKQKWEVVPV